MKIYSDKVEAKSAALIKLTNDLISKYNSKNYESSFDDLCEQEEDFICSLLDDVLYNVNKLDRFVEAKVESVRKPSSFEINGFSNQKTESVKVHAEYETYIKSGDQPWERWSIFNSIEDARKNLAALTDTPYRINVRIFKNGCLLEESGCNYFYSASKEVVNEYVSGKSNPFEKKALNNGN